MNSDADAKIKMLKSSRLCFVYGLLAALPILGFGFGMAALRISGQVRVAERSFWNAARPYRICGVVCAALCVIFWSFIVVLIMGRIMNVF
jgi:hypothetical protein